MRSDHLKRLLLALLVVLIGAVFWNSLSGDFLNWDDDINVSQNAHIRSLDAQEIRWMFTDTQTALRYKPLSWLAWALIYRCAGLAPSAFHLANLLIHCLNTALLFQLLCRFYRISGFNGKGATPLSDPSASMALGRGEAGTPNHLAANRQLLICAWGAAVWAIHPLRAEPVAWITGLPYGLALLFLLLSLLCYLRSTDSVYEPTRNRWYWSSVLAFLISALSYPIGLTFPLVLFVLDIFPFRRWAWGGDLRQLWRVASEKTPFLLIALVFMGLTVRGRLSGGGIWLEAASLSDFGFLSRVMQAFYIWCYYAWKFWLPYNLSPYYTTLIHFNPLGWQFIGSALAVISISFCALWKRRQLPLLCAGWFCYLLLLIPVLGLTEHPHFPSDRYAIVGSIVWSILLVAGLMKLRSVRPLIGLSGALALVIVFAVEAERVARIWQDDRSLVAALSAEVPDYVLVYNAKEFTAQRRYVEALDCYQKLLKINPDWLPTRENLASLLFDLNRLEEAEQQYKEIFRLAPTNAAARNNFGVLLASRGDVTNAIAQFQLALRLQPDLASAKQNLLRISLQQSQQAKLARPE